MAISGIIITKIIRMFCAFVNPDVRSVIINIKFLTDLYVMEIIDVGSRIALSMEAAHRGIKDTPMMTDYRKQLVD